MSKKSIIAIMYDFDKTLCTKDMQEYTFIPNVGMTATEFWKQSESLTKNKKMDAILAYMYLMTEKAHEKKISIHREDFVKMGKSLKFFPGVEKWFGTINQIGNELDMQVEHYIISSGLKEIIEGSSIYREFKEVFACEYLYDENDVVCWPKNAVNYTTKTQFLFRINKGVLDISEDKKLNLYTPDDKRRIPFRNMIYIGDGLTDVPCMKLVKAHGGHSIAVYSRGGKKNVASLIKDNRVDFIEKADYSEGSGLYSAVLDIMCKVAMVDTLKQRSMRQLKSC